MVPPPLQTKDVCRNLCFFDCLSRNPGEIVEAACITASVCRQTDGSGKKRHWAPRPHCRVLLWRCIEFNIELPCLGLREAHRITVAPAVNLKCSASELVSRLF
jgi:hypothetical protein